MNSTPKQLTLLFLVVLLAMTVGSAAFAGENDTSAAISNPHDRLAAKAMTDEELDDVNAGLFFNVVNVGGSVKVFNSPLVTKVRVGHHVKVLKFDFLTKINVK